MVDRKSPEARREPAGRDERAAYERPLLTDYGSFADLTQMPYRSDVQS